VDVSKILKEMCKKRSREVYRIQELSHFHSAYASYEIR